MLWFLVGLGWCVVVLQVEIFTMYLWYLELKETNYNLSQKRENLP